MNHRSEDGDDGADQRRSSALIGLIIILALAIAGVLVVRELREKSRLEDCLMAGRHKCAPFWASTRPLEPPPRVASCLQTSNTRVELLILTKTVWLCGCSVGG